MGYKGNRSQAIGSPEYLACGCTVDYKGLVVVSSVEIIYASDARIIALFPGKFHHFVK